jgi:hypothetical protein
MQQSSAVPSAAVRAQDDAEHALAAHIFQREGNGMLRRHDVPWHGPGLGIVINETVAESQTIMMIVV